MANDGLIVGLDIGSTKIAATAGRLHEGGIEIVAATETPNTGVRKGMVTDIEETVGAITTTLETLEQTAEAPVIGVVAGMSGVEVATQISNGVIAVGRPDGEVTEEDVARVVEAARSITLPPNREILHCLPRSFTTDHDTNVLNPVGAQSIRLEVTTQLITASTLAIRNLERAVSQANLPLEEIVFAPLAAEEAVLSKRQTESGVMLMDFGAATTDIAVFEEGHLMHAAVVPIGSQHITNDIAIGVRTSLEIAEQLKRECGTASARAVKANEVVHLADYSPDDTSSIKRQYLAEIIEARLNELFGRINDELKLIDRDGRLPAGVVILGNGAKLDGLIDYAKQVLKLPATIAKPKLELAVTLVDTEDAPDYTTSIGLLLWGLERGSTHSSVPMSLSKLPNVNVSGVVDRAKNLFKQFLP